MIATSMPSLAQAKYLTTSANTLAQALVDDLVKNYGNDKNKRLGIDIEDLNLFDLAPTNFEAKIFLLLRNGLSHAFCTLLQDCRRYLAESDLPVFSTALLQHLEEELNAIAISVDFFPSPEQWSLLPKVVAALKKALIDSGVEDAIAFTIAERFPSFFPYALYVEWVREGGFYAELGSILGAPFPASMSRASGWGMYSALLNQRLEQSIFDEPFSLRQIYIPLNAYYLTETTEEKQKLHVFNLEDELKNWLTTEKPRDAIRLISGGAGSGKTSFTRAFAAKIAAAGEINVLFVPLHLIDPDKSFADEIGRFVREEGILGFYPLHPEAGENDLLLILDGIDELNSQGQPLAQTISTFLVKLHDFVQENNKNSEFFLRILLTGSKLHQDKKINPRLLAKLFSEPSQRLQLLPYFLGENTRWQLLENVEIVVDDPLHLTEYDARDAWWEKYSLLTGRKYTALPTALGKPELAEITAQPLLNYLLALSFCRGQLNFAQTVSLNQIYCDLVLAVQQRAYEEKCRDAGACYLNSADFFLILEEIGLATWHDGGQGTTIRHIEEYCATAGLATPLHEFRVGAGESLTRLLAAFFFRHEVPNRPEDASFIFTHKSFSEYLTARRLVRGMRDIQEEMGKYHAPERRGKIGWDAIEALSYWVTLCGAAPITSEILSFLRAEVAALPLSEVTQIQSCFSQLFTYVLAENLPMQRLGLSSFAEMQYQARNAEESLLAALNACALVTKQLSEIRHPDKNMFGSWLKRVENQGNYLLRQLLSYLALSNINLEEANLRGANLEGCDLQGSDLSEANLENAKLMRAILIDANLHKANLQGSNLTRAELINVNLAGGSLFSANLSLADLRAANLKGVNFKGANLEYADLQQANLFAAILRSSNLKSATLRDALLIGADLEYANVFEADLTSAELAGANLQNIQGLAIDS